MPHFFFAVIVFMTKTVTVFPAVTTRNSEFSAWASCESLSIFLYIVILWGNEKNIPESRFYFESQPPDIYFVAQIAEIAASSAFTMSERGREGRPSFACSGMSGTWMNAAFTVVFS